MNAPNHTHTFATPAELEAWAAGVRYRAGRKMETARPFERSMIAAARDARIRRVTLAHQHLPTPPAPKEGGGV